MGNTRVSVDRNGSAPRVIQEDEYYNFGLSKPTRGYDNANNNRYLYHGKETQTDLANQYNYGARFYDPVIARWTSVDPLAENYKIMSPYIYVANNPLNHIDPDGRDMVHILVPRPGGGLQVTMVDDKVARRMQKFAWDAYMKYGYYVNSGFRSKDKQKMMRNNWDAGKRAGMRFQPAKKSAHNAGMAFDFSMPENINKEELAHLTNLRASRVSRQLKMMLGIICLTKHSMAIQVETKQ